MVIQRHFINAAVLFSIVLASGAFTPCAAESLSTERLSLEAALIDVALVPPPAVGFGPADLSVQRVVDGIGSDELASRPSDDADAPVVLQTETIDPWAEAFAESCRLAARIAAREPSLDDPRYPVVLNTEVQFFLERFTGRHREVVTLWVNRSARYLTMIREVRHE